MSCWASTSALAQARSDEIDRGLEEDSKRLKREVQILLLGCSGSGKNTILKQMKVAHEGWFSRAELAEFRQAIHRDVLDAAKQVVEHMNRLRLVCVEDSNKALAEKILEYCYGFPGGATVLSTEIGQVIHQVFKDPIIPRVMDEGSSDKYIMDSASYFLGEVLRIAAPWYMPDFPDVMRARAKRVGITEKRFTIGQLSGPNDSRGRINVVDVGGQRSERKKWIHYFESVTTIIFCAALSDYNQVLLEDSSQNRMLESLILFESVINSRWFLRTSIILFLNKLDLFKNKLPKAPLEHYFPEYTGGNNLIRAARYILWKFMQANRARLSVYPHLIQATGATDIIRFVIPALKETILQNALQHSGIQ